MHDPAGGPSAPDPARSSPTCPAFRSARGAAFSPTSISRPTANTSIDVADMATHIWGNGMEFENPLVVTLDNKLVYETVIGGEEDMKLYDQVQNGALDRVNARLKNIRFFATAGPHRIGVAFKRRTFAESDDQLQMFAPGGGQDRLYRVNSFQLRGPFDAKGHQSDAEPRAHLQLPAR